MKKLGVNEIREAYLSFFESKNHTRLASAPLIPQGDKSLLLINSGMAPLKKYFLGQETPPNFRVTTCQKCIRTPDIERVGKTSRHGTYFEMLGNFSFGDYFKHEATAWAWEFFTKVMELPAERLYVSVYEEDDETYDIWTKEIGVDPSHMKRLGKEDNFWEHGSGPCGPCSEIYFDRGEDKGCGSPDCFVGCDCDRFVEVWNLVFSQFDSDGNGNYTLMEKKNIDTGMGLERLACVMQEVDNLFEVDTVANIMNHICSIAGVEYKKDEKTDISLRVITDHIRSTTFMVGDGIMPSNEGRGYVLRRLLRRAARHGRLLGINDSFLYKVCETVINENKSAYPELEEKHDYIVKVIKIEEENFARTIDKGSELLNQIIAKAIEADVKVISGEDCFKLSDTFGFPIDLTIEIAQEKGLGVDEEGYRELMLRQREMARSDRANKAGSSWAADSIELPDIDATEFVGYGTFECEADIKAIIVNSECVESVNSGDEALIVLDKTPFYAESGGQVGDCGKIIAGGVFKVSDTKKLPNGHIIHIGKVESDSLNLGSKCTAKVCKCRRSATMRNHTAAHLLQAALREVLGDHVHQAGQLVNSECCRFDFSHFSAMTSDEIAKVEKIVNDKILSAVNVNSEEMPIEEAKKLGAMALFGEKYGNIVRVVSVADGFSTEFCGGTHVDNTAKLGLFKIISESSVASGVRRIEAVTGSGVLEYLNNSLALINNASAALKLQNSAEIPAKCAALVNDNKSLEKQIFALNQKIAETEMNNVFKPGVEYNGITLTSAMVRGVKPDVLRQLGDKFKDNNPAGIALIAGVDGESGTFCCICGKDAVARGAHAGKIVGRVAAVTGGKGGGRPDSAMAGIGKTYMVDEALAAFESIVKDFIN